MNSEEPPQARYWVETILDELEDLERSLPDPKVISADLANYPPWAVKVAAEVLKVGMPTVGLREGLQKDARVLGALMGSQYARVGSLGELLKEPTPEQQKAIERIDAWVENCQRLNDSNSAKEKPPSTASSRFS